nr:flavin reductase [uncultured Actinoplanes sp.]
MTTAFRQVIGNFMSGVVVITASHDDVRYGMTVSAVCSLSLEPPMLLVCLNSASTTQKAVSRSGRFAVNILAEHQGDLADRFARPGDRFAGVATSPGRTGVPLLPEALATVECRVVETVGGGTHRVFLAEVVHASARAGAPLAYFRGRFGRFELAQDADAYRHLRQMVLDRRLGPDTVLDVDALATRLEMPASSVFYALTRLVGDKLVRRDPSRGHLVAPLDITTSDDTHDARLAIELGAAAMVVGRLSAAQLGELRSLAETAASHFHDIDRYIRANHAFHRFFVDATGVRALADAYEQLSLPDVMARALPSDMKVDAHLVGEHFELVDALERADLAAVRLVLLTHNEHAKATQRAGIERSGGRL